MEQYKIILELFKVIRKFLHVFMIKSVVKKFGHDKLTWMRKTNTYKYFKYLPEIYK